LIVDVSEARPVVASFRDRFDRWAVDRRVPPHVIVLFPFAPACDVDASLEARVGRHFGRFDPFDARLERVRQFGRDEVVWLSPEPRQRFLALLVATHRAFPTFPPYGGERFEPEPHLTVAHTADGSVQPGVFELAQAELGPKLPIRFRVSRVSLLVEKRDATWAIATTYTLG
jgi:hypothetical protein